MAAYTPLNDVFGTEVSGVDLSGDLPREEFARLYETWVDRGLLVIRGQTLSPAQLSKFSSRFGEIVVYTRSENAHREHPEILVLSNIVANGKPIGAPRSGRYWHTDGHFLEAPPSASILYGVEVPPVGGDTWFADTRAAYDALDETLKHRLAGLRVIISRARSVPYNYPERPPVTAEQRAAWPDMPQPLVRTHPESSRKGLYVGGNVPWLIEGMDEQDSTPLVRSLQEHCIRPEFTYVHRWQPGDVLVWDNRSLIHKATEFDSVAYRRLMLRTAIEGDRPF